MKDKKTLLIIGCGSIGKKHARLLSERSDVLLWVCDTNTDSLDKICSMARVEDRFTDYKVALEKNPEMVWVCTPEESHAAISIDALHCGSDVFCEKPLSVTVKEGQKIVDAVKETGRTFVVGYMLRCSSAIMLIKKLLDEKRIGNILSAEVCLGDYMALIDFCETDYCLEAHGKLVIDYTHEIDYLRWFLGEPKEVAAMSTRIGNLEKMPDPNVVTAMLHFESGPLVGLHLDYIQYPTRRSIELFGDRGRIYYWQGRNYVEVEELVSKDEPEKIELTDERDDWFRMEQTLFLEAVEGTKTPLVTAQNALDTLKVAEAILKAAELKRTVLVNES